MKVILLRDVAKIGRRFEVKEVPGGHALNFLIPRKLAEPATAEALRRLGVEMKKKSIMTDRHDESFKTILDTLGESGITLTVAANEQGHLFKGIHGADIAKHLESKGMHVDAKEVVLREPIKELGTHTITLASGTVSGTCTLTIIKA
jgi:large subunit ribosomal protein L9